MKRRAEILKEFVETHIPSDLEDFPEIVSEALQRNGDSIRNDVVRAFESVCAEASERQEKGTLGRVSAVSFSFLRTEFIKGKGVYRIDVLDEDGLADSFPFPGYWEAAFAFEPYFRITGDLKKNLHGFGAELRDAHADYFSLAFCVFPQLAANAFLANIAPRLAAHPAYSALSRAKSCVITVGEYDDLQATIHTDEEGSAA
jgi:hypothetical protein